MSTITSVKISRKLIYWGWVLWGRRIWGKRGFSKQSRRLYPLI